MLKETYSTQFIERHVEAASEISLATMYVDNVEIPTVVSETRL